PDVVRRGQIGRAAEQFGNSWNQSVEHSAGGLARRDLGVLGTKLVAHFSNDSVEAGGQFGVLAAQEFAAPLGRSGGEPLFPGLPYGNAASARLAPLLSDVVGHDKGRVFPAEPLARPLDLLGAERIAVGRGGPGLGRRAE